MRVESYRFGRIVIGGTAYGSDVIVFHDRVTPRWRRKQGHGLCGEDLGEIIAARPSTLIVGRGAMGMMRVPAETRTLLEERGIDLVALRTGKAVDEYNRHADDPTVVGAFHLTC